LKKKGKTVGLCPTPRELFEKSSTKNFNIKIAHLRDFVIGVKGTSPLAGVWGEQPHDFPTPNLWQIYTGRLVK
jgi:hypothetical protein